MHFWDNWKERARGIATDSDYIIYSARKQKYKTKSPRPLVSMILAGLIGLSSLSPYLFSREKNYPPIQEPVKVSQTIQAVPASDVVYEAPREEQKKISKVHISDKKKIIYADVLERTGTTFEGTTTLKYTKSGIRVPGAEYGIIFEGKDYLPNENNLIELPDKAIGKKVRLTKIDLEKIKDSGKEKYLASFSTWVKMDDEQDTLRYAGKNLEDKFDSAQSKNPESNIPLYASISIADFPETKNFEGLERKIRESEEYLGLSYKIPRINKNGYLRSDTSVVRNLMYQVNGEEMSFDDSVMALKMQGYSNKDIAGILTRDSSLMTNVNFRQVSDSLKAQKWISLKEFNKHREKYIDDSEVVVYDGKRAIIRTLKTGIDSILAKYYNSSLK